MDELYRKRLIAQAKAIEAIYNLDPKELEWLRPLLSRGIRSTLDLLDAISSRKMSFEEIATDLGLNPTTVAQKLNALAEGGASIDMDESAAFAPTGRPRKLARR